MWEKWRNSVNFGKLEELTGGMNEKAKNFSKLIERMREKSGDNRILQLITSYQDTSFIVLESDSLTTKNVNTLIQFEHDDVP